MCVGVGNDTIPRGERERDLRRSAIVRVGHGLTRADSQRLARCGWGSSPS